MLREYLDAKIIYFWFFYNKKDFQNVAFKLTSIRWI